VLQAGGVATAIGLLLYPGLLGDPEIVAATPAVAALLTQLLLAQAIRTPLSRRWFYQGGCGGDGRRCSRGSLLTKLTASKILKQLM
jgi:hypothetical protein